MDKKVYKFFGWAFIILSVLTPVYLTLPYLPSEGIVQIFLILLLFIPLIPLFLIGVKYLRVGLGKGKETGLIKASLIITIIATVFLILGVTLLGWLLSSNPGDAEYAGFTLMHFVVFEGYTFVPLYLISILLLVIDWILSWGKDKKRAKRKK